MPSTGTVIGSAKGAALEQVLLKHPFQARDVAIICGRHVTVEAGTGLVHTAPAHGTDDYLIGKVYGLPVNNPVGDDGRFVAGTPALAVGELAGRTVWEANRWYWRNSPPTATCCPRKSSTVTRTAGATRHRSSSVPRRSGSSAWSTAPTRPKPPRHRPRRAADTALVRRARVDETQFFPTWGRARLEAMMRTRPDWCVSRQRNWGVPLPFFPARETGAPHPRTGELIEAVAQRVEKAGIEAWFALDASELLGAEAERVSQDERHPRRLVRLRRDALERPARLASQPTGLPGRSLPGRLGSASRLVPEFAADRLRNGWPRPYKALLTHGFVVDGKGLKMSKSRAM
jgi:isoleucyl-tRNA synthetase